MRWSVAEWTKAFDIKELTAEMKNNFGTDDLEYKQTLNYRITSQNLDELVTRQNY